MAKIPFSTEQRIQPDVQRMPRADASAAAAPWKALAQVGEVVSDVGGMLAEYQQQKKVATHKAEVADFNQKLKNREVALEQSLAEINDPDNATEEYLRWETDQRKWAESIQFTSDDARAIAMQSLVNSIDTKNITIMGGGGDIDKKRIASNDISWVEMQQRAIDGEGAVNPETGEQMNAEKAYNYATDQRLGLGTIDTERALKDKRGFGQTAYYRQSYKALDVDFETAVKDVDITKMSQEQAKEWQLHRFEVQNKIDKGVESVQNTSFSQSTAEANRGELTTSQIAKLESENITVYGGVRTKALSKDRADALRATVSGQVSVDKSTSNYKQIMSLISDGLLKGDIDREEVDGVLSKMTKNGKAIFSTQTNLDLLNQIESVFQIGKKFDPSGSPFNATKINQIHGKAIGEVVDAFEQQADIRLVDSKDSFIAVKARIDSLMDMFAEKGASLSSADYLEWRKENMADIDLDNAESAQRNSVTTTTNPSIDSIWETVNAN